MARRAARPAATCLGVASQDVAGTRALATDLVDLISTGSGRSLPLRRSCSSQRDPTPRDSGPSACGVPTSWDATPRRSNAATPTAWYGRRFWETRIGSHPCSGLARRTTSSYRQRRPRSDRPSGIEGLPPNSVASTSRVAWGCPRDISPTSSGETSCQVLRCCSGWPPLSTRRWLTFYEARPRGTARTRQKAAYSAPLVVIFLCRVSPLASICTSG